MDASTLSALIDASSQELAALHARLGCAPDALERAMAALKTCIHDAIRAHVAEAEADVARAQESCAAHEEAIAQLCAATGGEPALVPEMPLLARCEALVADRARLERTYTAQAEQCDLVLSQVRTLNACMSAAGGSCPEAEVAASGSLRDVTPAALSRLEAHLQHVQQVYTERKMQMEAQLSEVLQLWAETHTMPHVAMHAGRASVAAERVDESRFHLAILQYTQQVPDMADGVFRGEFLMSDDAPAELLQPTNDVLQRCATLIDTLAREKTQRESQIQTYYDELCELWVRLGATDEEMDAFVLEHRGSTLDVVEAYRAELERMRELKASNMGSFIRSTREAIWELWDRLYVSEDERQSTFPAFFVELPEHAADAAPFDWDHVLEQHEQMCAELAAAHEQRLPLLDLMERYRAICDDERALNESAHDAARLLGRGNRGDPGRLLREEKMRKRVKAQKPRLEQELLRAVPAWEEQQGVPFMIDGARLVDTLREQLAAKENRRSRVPAAEAKARAPVAERAPSVLKQTRTANAATRAPSALGARGPRTPGVQRGVAAPQRTRVGSHSRPAPYAETPRPIAAGARRRDPLQTPSSTLASSLRGPHTPAW